MITKLLSEEKAAGLLGISKAQLRHMRENGQGPNYVYLEGGARMYILEDLLHWLKQLVSINPKEAPDEEDCYGSVEDMVKNIYKEGHYFSTGVSNMRWKFRDAIK